VKISISSMAQQQLKISKTSAKASISIIAASASIMAKSEIMAWQRQINVAHQTRRAKL